jgi:hypothetical protein
MSNAIDKLTHNMDLAFNNLYIVNIVVESLIFSMTRAQAKRFVVKLDSFLVNPEEVDSIATAHLEQMQHWREDAAKIAGLPRQPN